MASKIKSVGRALLRAYLTYTPITKGRYPLMMALHKYLSEPVTVTVKTKDRGMMILDLEDEAQFTMFYNMYEWSYQPVIDSLIDNTKITIDVGANIGQYTLLFAGNSNKVYAFEPSRTMVERLKKQVEVNNIAGKVIIIPKALSNKTGQLHLTIPLSSNTGQATTIIEKGSELRTETIAAITLDEYVDTQGISEIDLVKMDIEGGELFALQGMKKTLSGKNKPIVILEMNDTSMSAAGYSASDILQELSQYGYRPYKFLRIGKLKSLDGTAFTPASENYCFLTSEHLNLEKVKRVLL